MLANAITSLRILGTIVLLFIEPLSFPFYIVYIVCIGSDVVDGYIARKTNTTSVLGSKLDSLADALLLVVMLWISLPILQPTPFLIGWIMGIACVKIIALCIGFYRYHKLTFLHTYLNKLTGILLFCLFLLMLVIQIDVLVNILCIVATLSAVEDCIINSTSEKLDLDVKGLFFTTKKK